MKKFTFLLLLLLSGQTLADSQVEQFLSDTKTEHNLSEDTVQMMRSEIENTDPYLASRKLFCFEIGGGAVIDIAVFNCKSFKGETIEFSLLNLGASVALHSGVGILYAKKGSRKFKEGTYDASLKAMHFGLGGMGLRITNKNESINWRFRGLTFGAGINVSHGILTMRKIN